MERENWEIVWHIHLQVAAGYLTMTEAACRVMKINRVEFANRSIEQANALVEKHGGLGTDALFAAEDSLEALAATEFAGLVKVAGTTKSSR